LIDFRQNRLPRVAVLFVALSGLVTIYLNQRFGYIQFISNAANGQQLHPNFIFAANRTIRFILNDLLAILVIWALFYQRKYVLIAFFIQMLGLFVVLPAYLALKLSLEGASEISSPLLSFLHRIIIHPVLILLLIPAFFLKQISRNRADFSQ